MRSTGTDGMKIATRAAMSRPTPGGGRHAVSPMKLLVSRTTSPKRDLASGNLAPHPRAGELMVSWAWRPLTVVFGWNGTPSLPTSDTTA